MSKVSESSKSEFPRLQKVAAFGQGTPKSPTWPATKLMAPPLPTRWPLQGFRTIYNLRYKRTEKQLTHDSGGHPALNKDLGHLEHD